MNLTAVRTVSDSGDEHIIEGLAFPFRGRDTYGTYFSARTDFHWDLFPDSFESPQYVRPLTYHHGFEPDFGLARIGGWSPVRTDEDGVWVRAQLDKRQQFYATRVKPLLDSGALGLSGGSAEHSVRIDERSGEILDWPSYEVALTPTESNPLAQLATRAGDIAAIITIRATDKTGKPVGGPVGGKEREDIPEEDFAGPDKSYPIVDQASVDGAARLVGHAEDPEAVKAKIIAIAKRKGFDIPDAWKEGGAAKAVRAGRRNSAADTSALTAAHDHIASVLSMPCAPGEPDGMDDDSDDPSSRSGTDAEPVADGQPAKVTIAVRQDAPTFDELAARLAARATETGAEVARRLTR